MSFQILQKNLNFKEKIWPRTNSKSSLQPSTPNGFFSWKLLGISFIEVKKRIKLLQKNCKKEIEDLHHDLDRFNGKCNKQLFLKPEWAMS